MKSLGTYVWETIKFAALTILVVLPIRAYVAQPFVVSGVSMSPSFEDGQYLIIDELSYLLKPPERGEVVVFRYPKDPSKFFIKRIVGLPHETILLDDNKVFLVQDGKTIPIPEPPLVNRELLGSRQIELGPGEYFVLGDNRGMSLDSRVWGPVPEQLIKGRVFARLLPLQKIALWPAAININER